MWRLRVTLPISYVPSSILTHDVDKSCTRIIPCSSDARVEVEDKSTLRLKLFSLDDAYDRKLTFSSLVVRSGGSLWLLFHFNPSLHRGNRYVPTYLAIVGKGPRARARSKPLSLSLLPATSHNQRLRERVRRCFGRGGRRKDSSAPFARERA